MRLATICLLAVLSGLTLTPAFAVDHMVVVGGGAGLAYSPSSLNITVGDTVTFMNKATDGGGGFHNVHTYGTSVTTFQCSNDCLGGANSTPSSNAWSDTVAFNTVETVTYHCDQHGSVVGGVCSGMCGTITVNASTPVHLQSFEVD